MQNLFFWAFVIILIIAIAELLYILSLRNNIRSIARDFSEKLSMDTNTTVSVSIVDPEIRRMALLINRELKQLRKERLKLQQGDQELKNAVTNIAHDIRTPLAAISGYLELMEAVPTDEKGHRYLTVIRERTEALKRLTEELFQYSVITSACDDIKSTNLSLKSELEIALAGAYGMLSQRGIVPEIHMPETDVKRTLDHIALQRIFSNILANTAKYSDGDLTVILTETGEIIFKNRASGLSQVETDRLFDRFYTVNEWLQRRIRMYIWKQWKIPKTKLANLKKLGMPEWQAHRNGNTRKGYRAIAGSGILQHTITNERLARRGYYDISEAYKSLHGV